MIRAVTVLVGFELFGEALRAAARLPAPGPVIGMLALAVVLIARRQSSSDHAVERQPEGELERVANGLITNMGLLFVPAGVGVITEASLLKAQWLPILVGVLGSTLIGLVVTALVMHRTLPQSDAPLVDSPEVGVAQ